MMTALLVLAALALFITFVTSIVLLGLNIVVARDVRDILTLTKINTSREAVMDRTLTTMASAIMSAIPPGMPPLGPDLYPGQSSMTDLRNQSTAKRPHVSESFETEDGRHSDPTLRGLLEKILNDPNYKITRPEDVKKIQDLFDQAEKNLPKDPRDPPVHGSSGGVFPTPPGLPPIPPKLKDNILPDEFGIDDFDEEDEDDGA